MPLASAVLSSISWLDAGGKAGGKFPKRVVVINTAPGIVRKCLGVLRYKEMWEERNE